MSPQKPQNGRRVEAEGCCTGGSIEVTCGARTGDDIVGAMLVAPEEIGVDMQSRASEGVSIGRASLASSMQEVVGSGGSNELRRLLGRALGR
jgi:hypothetical protein